jgi:hypothetical protein
VYFITLEEKQQGQKSADSNKMCAPDGTTQEKRKVLDKHCSFTRQKCAQQRSQKDFKIEESHSRNTSHVKYKNKIHISNNRGNWNHLEVIHKIPEQHIGKARHQGTAHIFGKVKGKTVNFTLKQAMKTQTIIYLGVRWVCVVSATPRPLYPQKRDAVSNV